MKIPVIICDVIVCIVFFFVATIDFLLLRPARDK